MRYDANPVIARSGWLSLGLLSLLALVLWRNAGTVYAAPVALVALLVAFKFRDPDRKVPGARLGILSPVDGHVTEVQRIEDGPFGGPALRVLIAISPLTVYGVRSPIEGVVNDPATLCRSVGYHRGLCLRTDEGQPLLLRLAHFGFGAPKAKVNIGQRLGQGERCGSVRFAHSAELLMPASAAARIAPRDAVEAGTTVLAEFASR